MIFMYIPIVLIGLYEFNVIKDKYSEDYNR